MKTMPLDIVTSYVNEHIVDFHRRRIGSLETLRLSKLLKKNPYLFRAKNIETAGTLMKGLLDAFLSSSVTTQPRLGSCLKRNGHRLKRPKMTAGKRESSIYTP